MDELFSYFMDGVHDSFRAISRNDLEYWVSHESVKYLETNRRVIERGPTIERIFLLSKKNKLTEAELGAIRRQINMGVRIRIAFLEDCQGIVADDRELDFGLFDEFAVSFWRIIADRIFRISTSVADCKTHKTYYERVSRNCVHVPNKNTAEKMFFQTVEELNSWAAAREGASS